MSKPFLRFERFRNMRSANASRQTLNGRDRRGEDIDTDVISLTCDRPAPTITPKGFILVVALFLAFKGAVIAHLGFDTYTAAVAKLENGALVEQASAFIMRPDALSQAIAGQIGVLLHRG